MVVLRVLAKEDLHEEVEDQNDELVVALMARVAVVEVEVVVSFLAVVLEEKTTLLKSVEDHEENACLVVEEVVLVLRLWCFQIYHFQILAVYNSK